MATVREARRPPVPVRTEPAERRPFRDNPRLILLGIVVLFAALAAMIFLADKSTQLNPDFLSEVLLYAGVYATGVMHWGPLDMLLYGIILTVLAVIGGFAARWFDSSLGPKRAVQLEIFMSIVGIVALLGMAPDRILYFWHWDSAACPC